MIETYQGWVISKRVQRLRGKMRTVYKTMYGNRSQRENNWNESKSVAIIYTKQPAKQNGWTIEPVTYALNYYVWKSSDTGYKVNSCKTLKLDKAQSASAAINKKINEFQAEIDQLNALKLNPANK